MLCIREIYCTSTLPESKHLKSLKHERGMFPADFDSRCVGGCWGPNHVAPKFTWNSRPPPPPARACLETGPSVRRRRSNEAAKVERGFPVHSPGPSWEADVPVRRMQRAGPARGHGEQSPRGDPSVGASATVPTSPCGRVCPASTSFCTVIKQIICQNLTSFGGTNIWAHPTPGRETAGTLCNERCPEALSHKSDFLPPGSCALSHEHLATAFQAS